jgi:hypothetical protein
MFLFNFLIGAAILLLLWLGLRWFAQAKPGQVITAIKWGAALIGGAVAVWLTVTGRLANAIMLITMMAPLFVRWKALWTRLSNAGGPRPGNTSDVESAWFRMSLDHDTGAMDGVILKGSHRGRRLSELAAADLLAILADARIEDPESAALLEAYLDRVQPAWRAGDSEAAPGGEPPRSPSGAMAREEAYRILGLQPGASEDQIRDAHRRLMKSNHPDLGGSDYLAAKINEAKERLLGN